MDLLLDTLDLLLGSPWVKYWKVDEVNMAIYNKRLMKGEVFIISVLLPGTMGPYCDLCLQTE
jgi:hypothetical protein